MNTVDFVYITLMLMCDLQELTLKVIQKRQKSFLVNHIKSPAALSSLEEKTPNNPFILPKYFVHVPTKPSN